MLAAAGLIALEKSPSRLHEDHANARYLAEALARLPGIRVDLRKVQTNIIIFDVSGTGRTAAEISAALAKRNVLANPTGSTTSAWSRTATSTAPPSTAPCRIPRPPRRRVAVMRMCQMS